MRSPQRRGFTTEAQCREAFDRAHAEVRNQRFVLVLVLESVGKIPAQNRDVNLCATLLDSCMVSPSNFDHEKLDVYQLEATGTPAGKIL